MEELKRVLGKKIREAREEKGVTQKELGELLQYSPMGISHFENGIRDIKLSDLQKLAGFFQKDLNYFLSTETTFFRANHNTDPEVSRSLEKFEEHISKLKNE